MGTFNKRETSGNHHCVSLILFSPIPAPTGGKWNRFETSSSCSKVRRPLESPLSILIPFDYSPQPPLKNIFQTPPGSLFEYRTRRYRLKIRIHFIPKTWWNAPFRLALPRQKVSVGSGRGEIGLRSITKLERSARENDDCILLARRSDARKDLSTAKFFHPASAMAAQGPSLLPFHAVRVINRFQALSLLVQRRGSRDKK